MHIRDSVYGNVSYGRISEQILIRREAMDIREVLDRRITAKDGVIHMMNGSRREGFTLIGSDMDTMFRLNKH